MRQLVACALSCFILVDLSMPLHAQENGLLPDQFDWHKSMPFGDRIVLDPVVILESNGFDVADAWRITSDGGQLRPTSTLPVFCKPVTVETYASLGPYSSGPSSATEPLFMTETAVTGVASCISVMPDLQAQMHEILKGFRPDAIIYGTDDFIEIKFFDPASRLAGGAGPVDPCPIQHDTGWLNWTRCKPELLATADIEEAANKDVLNFSPSLPDLARVVDGALGGVGALVRVGGGTSVAVTVDGSVATFYGLRKMGLTDRIGSLCRGGFGADGDPIAALRDMPVLAHCGGAVTSWQGKAHFITAKHCVEDFTGEGRRLFAVFDFLRGSRSIDPENMTFRSTSFIELTGLPVVEIDGFDLALVELPDDAAKPYKILDPETRPLVPEEKVIAMGFPSGVPFTPVAGDGVRVAAVKGNLAFATIDGFKNSSGSPVFDAEGKFVAVLSSLPELEEDLDWYPASDPDGRKCWRPRVFGAEIEGADGKPSTKISVPPPYVQVMSLGVLHP